LGVPPLGRAHRRPLPAGGARAPAHHDRAQVRPAAHRAAALPRGRREPGRGGVEGRHVAAPGLVSEPRGEPRRRGRDRHQPPPPARAARQRRGEGEALAAPGRHVPRLRRLPGAHRSQHPGRDPRAAVRVESEGASLHYEVRGDGPVVVLAHGAGGDALSWWQQVPDFARAFRLVTFAPRGFARSSCPPEGVHPRHFAADLAAILAAEKVGDVALVCQSMGGWTGLAFALAHPERVRALVLCGTPGGLLTERLPRELPALAERVRTRGVPEMALGLRFRREAPALAFLYQQLNELSPPATATAMAGRLFELVVREEQLEGWRTPTLVVAGDD